MGNDDPSERDKEQFYFNIQITVCYYFGNKDHSDNSLEGNQ